MSRLPQSLPFAEKWVRTARQTDIRTYAGGLRVDVGDALTRHNMHVLYEPTLLATRDFTGTPIPKQGFGLDLQ